MTRKNSKKTSPEQVQDAAEPVATEEQQGGEQHQTEQVTDNGPRIEELRGERDQLAARLAEVNAELRTLTGAATPSTVESPVAVCREVFEDMPGAPRKDVVAACVAGGVNKATAQTQYQVNRKKHIAGELSTRWEERVLPFSFAPVERTGIPHPNKQTLCGCALQSSRCSRF